jgi:hypothetical protein
MTKTRKNVPWNGWKNQKTSTHQRTVMLEQCGKKCFLGPNKSFPICIKNTCKRSKKGIYAAYIRAREWKHKKIASKAKRLLK